MGGWLVNGPARVSRPRVAKTAANLSAQVLVLWPSRALCPCESILSSPARSFPVAYVAVTPLLGVMGAPRRAAVTVWRSSVHSRSMASSEPRGSLHCVDGLDAPGHGRSSDVPALAQAVMAPLICWSFSSSMFKYRLVDHAVPGM